MRSTAALRGRWAANALLALLLAGCTETGADFLYLGAALHGYPITPLRLQDVAAKFPAAPDIVVFFLSWPQARETGGFPWQSLEAVTAAGAIPCVTWEPWHHEEEREKIIDYQTILDGSYDPYIRGFAREAREWGHPFIIRFAHEMNLSRYHWGTEKTEYGPSSPAIYQKMFRYVVDLFRGEGAVNVLWAFSPNAESVPNEGYDPRATWNRIAHYYPGDGYIDILGMDGYNWGTSKTWKKDGWESRWLSFAEIFKSPLIELRKLSPSKPIIVFETATTSKGGDKALWIREAFATAAKWELRGIVWFEADKEEDWRIGKEAAGIPAGSKPSPLQWLAALAASNRYVVTGKEDRKEP